MSPATKSLEQEVELCKVKVCRPDVSDHHDNDGLSTHGVLHSIDIPPATNFCGPSSLGLVVLTSLKTLVGNKTLFLRPQCPVFMRIVARRRILTA